MNRRAIYRERRRTTGSFSICAGQCPFRLEWHGTERPLRDRNTPRRFCSAPLLFGRAAFLRVKFKWMHYKRTGIIVSLRAEC